MQDARANSLCLRHLSALVMQPLHFHGWTARVRWRVGTRRMRPSQVSQQMWADAGQMRDAVGGLWEDDRRRGRACSLHPRLACGATCNPATLQPPGCATSGVSTNSLSRRPATARKRKGEAGAVHTTTLPLPSIHPHIGVRYVEFADTIFLIVRGKPVSWLHYLHHIGAPINMVSGRAHVGPKCGCKL